MVLASLPILGIALAVSFIVVGAVSYVIWLIRYIGRSTMPQNKTKKWKTGEGPP